MFQALNTALTSLYANRSALEVTGNNIANVNTEGYTRQRVQTTEISGNAAALYAKSSKTGYGVQVGDVTRVMDQYYQSRTIAEHGTLSQLNAQNTGFTTIQDAFAEPSDRSLQSSLTNFWKSWDDLSNSPSDATRSAVVETSQTLTSQFRTVSNTLTDMSGASLNRLKSEIDQVNSYAKGIADLNTAIATATNSGGEVNSLLDKRDVLVSKVSDLIGVTVRHGSANTISLLVGGSSLVSGSTSNTLQVDDTGTPVTLRWDKDGDPTTVTDGVALGVSGGDISGQLDLINTTIPKYKGLLDGVAANLIGLVNTQHASGLDKSGNPGGAFFSGTDASTIGVDAAVVADPTLIAASATGTTSGSSDGENARRMADLARAGTGPDKVYAQLINVLGIEAQRVKNQAATQQSITNTADANLQSSSGVSLDEEMTNLISYQRSYDSAAKYMSVINDVLGTLINMVG
jgi:flagellar hook-associated protein 1 FlgK